MKERQNSLLTLRFWDENVQCMFVDRRQKISSAEDKQTNLELKQIEFSVSTYLFKSIYQ